MVPSLHHIAFALGGVVRRGPRPYVAAPYPGAKKRRDRSLHVFANGEDIGVHVFRDSIDPIEVKDHVRRVCGMPAWKPKAKTPQPKARLAVPKIIRAQFLAETLKVCRSRKRNGVAVTADCFALVVNDIRLLGDLSRLFDYAREFRISDEAIAKMIGTKPRHYTADERAKILNLTYAERMQLGLRRTGSIDVDKAGRERARRDRYNAKRKAKRAQARMAGVNMKKPSSKSRDITLDAEVGNVPKSNLTKFSLEELAAMNLTPGQLRSAGIGLKLAERHFEAVVSAIENGDTIEEACRKASAFLQPQILEKLARQDVAKRKRLRAALERRGCVRKTRGYPEDAFDEALRLIPTKQGLLWNEIAPGLPQFQTLKSRARRDPCFADRLNEAVAAWRAGGGGREYTEVEWEEALRRIEEHPTGSINKALSGRSGLASARAVRLRMQCDPKFRARVMSIIGDGSKRRREIKNVGALLEEIDRALPKGMQPHDREDARADIVADIIAGKLRRESVRTRAARYAQAYAPQFGSLDAPIEPGSDLTFRDTITADPDFEAWCCA